MGRVLFYKIMKKGGNTIQYLIKSKWCFLFCIRDKRNVSFVDIKNTLSLQTVDYELFDGKLEVKFFDFKFESLGSFSVFVCFTFIFKVKIFDLKIGSKSKSADNK